MDSGSDEDGGSMWSRNFTFGRDVRVRVEEEWGLGIGGTVWEGGVLLARYLSSPAFPAEAFRGKRAIEIGAGITGLPSLALAHRGVCSQIVVTDIDECTPALAENLASNLPPSCRLTRPPSAAEPAPAAARDGWELPASVLQVAAQECAASSSSPREPQADSAVAALGALRLGSDSSGPLLPNGGQPAANGSHAAASPAAGDSASAAEAEAAGEAGCTAAVTSNGAAAAAETEVVVRSLDWQEDPGSLQPPFELVLVADVVYIEELMLPLLRCMHALSGPRSTVLLAFYRRSQAATAAFWAALPRFFACEKVPEAAYGAPAHPEPVGLFLLKRL